MPAAQELWVLCQQGPRWVGPMAAALPEKPRVAHADGSRLPHPRRPDASPEASPGCEGACPRPALALLAPTGGCEESGEHLLLLAPRTARLYFCLFGAWWGQTGSARGCFLALHSGHDWWDPRGPEGGVSGESRGGEC